jgi:hypothetical protein
MRPARQVSNEGTCRVGLLRVPPRWPRRSTCGNFGGWEFPGDLAVGEGRDVGHNRIS